MKKLFYVGVLSALLLAACGSENAEESKNEPEKVEEVSADVQEEATEETTEDNAEEEEATNAVADIYDYDIPLLTEDILQLSETSYEFINTNADIFPAVDNTSIEKVKGMVNSDVTSKHLNKNVTPYLEDIVSVSGTVISIEESSENEFDVTIVHITDDEMNSYLGLMYKLADDVFEGDYVKLWGAPLGPSYFENISGGTTNVQVLAVSHLEK